MKTFQRCLIVLGAFVFAYNAGNLIHEFGHGINVLATGGSIGRISISPLSWSYISYAGGGEARATTWGGFLWETILPLLIFLGLWCIKSRASFWALLLAMVALATTAIYMLVGAFLDIGDAGFLVRVGLPTWPFVAIGAGLLLLCLLLALPLGTLLGIGRGRCSFAKTCLIVGAPILAYLLAIGAYNLLLRPDEWLMWTLSGGGGVVILMLVSGLIHLAAAWVKGDESRRRALPVNWLTAGLSLALGAGIVVMNLLLFPPSA